MRILIFFFLITLHSVYAMEIKKNPKSDLLVSANLLHSFSSASTFEQIKFNIHHILPENLCQYVYNFVDEAEGKEKQKENDLALIKQAYVNSYIMDKAFSQNTWEKIKSYIWEKYQIPYDNIQGKKLKVYSSSSGKFYLDIDYPKKNIPDHINKANVQNWIQKNDLCFMVYKDKIKCLDLSTNKTYDIHPIDTDQCVDAFWLDYKRSILFCYIPRHKKYGSECKVINEKALYAFTYKKEENQTLCFSEPLDLTNNLQFSQISSHLVYDNKSGLFHLGDSSPNNSKTVTFYDIFTGKNYSKQQWEQDHEAFNGSCFDPDIGVFALDENNNALILKPHLDYEKMEHFIKTITPQDRILMYAILKNGGFIQ